MLTGVVLERLPRWATEEAGRGERLPASRPPVAGSCYGVLLVPVLVVRLAVAQLHQPRRFPDVSATPVLKWISGPELARLINDFTNWFVDHVDTLHHRVQERRHRLAAQPAAGPARGVALVAEAPVLLAVAYVLGGWRPR